jgi:16S rRNA C967 or C1407 C5-methylase (RsmB/RsmF family)
VCAQMQRRLGARCFATHGRRRRPQLPPIGPAELAGVLEPFLEDALIHGRLDSALSQAEPQCKAALAVASSMILRRPDLFAGRGGLPWDHFPSVDDRRAEGWVDDAAEEAVRWFQRNPDLDSDPDRSLDGVESDAEEAFPPDMIHEWRQAWGGAKSAELARTLGGRAATTVRVGRKEDLRAVARSLSAELGTAAPFRDSRSSPVGLLCDGYARVMASAAFAEGRCSIQDEGSQVLALFALWPDLFAPYLSPSPGAFNSSDGAASPPPALAALPRWSRQGLKVVDACAGAGGKALAMADLLGGQGKVFAYDVAPWKLKRLRERAKGTALRNIQTLCLEDGDELAKIPRKHLGSADVVLVDAPCSGWGTLRKNPDLKFRQSARERGRLEALQLRLLRAFAPLVKPGGRLVYGTCTFRPEETSDVLAEFLDGGGGEFSAGPSGYFGPSPESDGFFMASLTKTEDAGDGLTKKV